MVAVSPVDERVNPNNTDQRYILWGNGRIDALGGAVPVTDGPQWFARFEPPGVALHVTDWATGAGYVLDYRGGFNPFGGAPDIGVINTSDPLKAGVPEVAGIPVTASPRIRRYIDWSWDPSGSGQGYVLDIYGQILAFGGAPALSRSGRRFTWGAARKFVMRWTPTKRGLQMDLHGGLWPEFAGTPAIGSQSGAYWPTKDFARDVVVTDWDTMSGYQLAADGRVYKFGTAPGLVAATVPVRPGADVGRKLEILDASDPLHGWVVWSSGGNFEFLSSTPPVVIAGSGVAEAQTVTITGAPTGGTFTLTFSGQTTAAIARNAAASAVQSALEALSNLAPGDVTVTGGPGPGTPWTVTFGGVYASTDVAQMTATSSLTGGTSPTVTVTTATEGLPPSPPFTVTDTTRPVLTWAYSDPQGDSQAAWQVLVFTQAFVNAHTMTDPLVWAASALVSLEGINPDDRGVQSPVDLPNGPYRMYVRAKDNAGQWSAWSNHGWTQNIATPTTPTGLSATPDQATLRVALWVTATTGENADLVRFEFSDDGGATWWPVRGADAVPVATATTATDFDPPLGIPRTYRAVAYAEDPAIASLPSATATATVTRLVYALTAVDNPDLGGEVPAIGPSEWSRPIDAAVFQGLDAEYPTILDDGGPRSRRMTLSLNTHDRAEWDRVAALATSRSVLVCRDPFGEVVYCKLAEGDWRRKLLEAAPLADEVTPLRHMHFTSLPLVEVKPPYLDV